ncbi:OsmC family protein [Haloimpatiens sp. FM7315]|uniref:OsmC family protein n=1 Tax=Haloimpatiens sp. FM7315 TaxID=3298609 RepID=UPI0035A2BAD1
MAIDVFKSTAKLTDGIRIECSSRDHKIVLDEPKNLGGSDEGMNPVEAVLCSLGACQCIVAKSFAKVKNINLEDFWVEIEGNLDTDGFTGKNKDTRIGLQEIRTKVHIKSSSPEEEIKKFVKFIEHTCPVEDTIKNSANLSSEIVIEK